MSDKVLDLSNEMVLKPDKYILTVLFHACGEVSNDKAKKIASKLLEEMPNTYRNDIILLNSLINMFMKFGDIINAEHVFDSIQKKDIVTFGCMMKGNI